MARCAVRVRPAPDATWGALRESRVIRPVQLRRPGTSRREVPTWFQNLVVPLFALTLLLGIAGCGDDQRTEAGHDHDHDHDHGSDHDHGEKAPAGASFQPGRGISLTDETRANLGLEITETALRNLPVQIPLTVQVFGEKHHHRLNPEDHTGCDVHGSGLVSPSAAAALKTGQVVEVLVPTNAPLGGLVLAVQKALALDESEVIIGVSNAITALQPGQFVPARIRLPREGAVLTIPAAALLRTAEGSFVYAVKEDALLRTAVKTGAETDGWVEVTDGLSAGSRIAVKPVETLWLIELRASKGGGHSH